MLSYTIEKSYKRNRLRSIRQKSNNQNKKNNNIAIDNQKIYKTRLKYKKIYNKAKDKSKLLNIKRIRIIIITNSIIL